MVAVQDLEHESLDPRRGSAHGELLEQPCADADALELVGHGERHLGGGGITQAVEAPESHHTFAPGLAEHADQRAARAPIGLEKWLDQARSWPQRRVKALGHAVRRERREECSQRVTIATARLPQAKRPAIAQDHVCEDAIRVASSHRTGPAHLWRPEPPSWSSPCDCPVWLSHVEDAMSRAERHRVLTRVGIAGVPHCCIVGVGMITVLLVDDHQLVRSGVRRVLEATERFDIVGEASGVREALDRARVLRPDVVVLDLGLRDGSGLDAIETLREGGTRVVVLSMQDEPAYARKAFELGAQGYVVKDAADEELAAAIEAVLADRIYVHPALAARLVMNEPEDDLTERERQILRLIALGYTNQEIAGQLYLSVRTIEAHRRHILDKLRLSTRADLVRYALEHRIVELGSS